jgi:hypothetical protein
MKPTDLIHESDELSLELKKILTKAGFKTFFDISRKTRLGLRNKVPKLKVRHLANLEQALINRRLNFYPDDSIWLDELIDQRKLYNLWKKGIDTYIQLDNLPFTEFEALIGGPQSRFFRNKKARREWLLKNKLVKIKRFELPHLTSETSDLLYKGGVRSLQETVQKTDYELARILQPGFGTTKASLKPLTRARLIELKYALMKEGIDRPFKPL